MKRSTKLVSTKMFILGLMAILSFYFLPLAGAITVVEPVQGAAMTASTEVLEPIPSLTDSADFFPFDGLKTSLVGPLCGPNCVYICTGSICGNGKKCAKKCDAQGNNCGPTLTCQADICFI